MNPLMELSRQYAAQTYAPAPVVFTSGRGAELFDDAGKRYIDLGSGIGVMSLGYGHPAWADAVAKQARTLAHTSNLFYNPATIELQAALCRRTGFSRVFLCNSGTEANECLIKTARRWAAQKKGAGEHPIVTLEGSFHGRSYGALTATGQKALHPDELGPYLPDFRYVPAEDLSALEEVLSSGQCAALLLEIVQGEGGVRPLSAEFLRSAEALCRRYDALLAVDEVQTGNGRTGAWFAFEHYGLKPDLVSTAKGLGNGLPIGAVLFAESTAGILTPGTHGSTFGGNPVASAGAKVVLDTIDDDFLAKVARKGEYLRKRLAAHPKVKDVSGLGLMIGFSVDGMTAQEFKAAALQAGVVVLTAHERVRLLPPLVISDEMLDEAVEMLLQTLDAA